MTVADTAHAKACKGEGYKFPVLWAFLWVIGIDEKFCTKMSWKFSRDAVARLNCGHSELQSRSRLKAVPCSFYIGLDAMNYPALRHPENVFLDLAAGSLLNCILAKTAETFGAPQKSG